MDFPQLFFNGLAIGSVIALAAVGLTLTYGILRLSNFAHGDFMTLGAYLTWLANISGINIWIALCLGAVGTVVAMLISEQLIWKTMRERRATSTTLIIISIGLAWVIRNTILMIWGGSNQRYDLPIVAAVDLFGVKVAYFQLVGIGLSAIAIFGLYFLLQKTKMGKAMRAVADNLDLARVSGINVEQSCVVDLDCDWRINGDEWGNLWVNHNRSSQYGLVPNFAHVCRLDFRGDWQPLRGNCGGLDHWLGAGVKRSLGWGLNISLGYRY